MSEARDLRAKAERYAALASAARQRTTRNTYLSLEQTLRALAANEERAEVSAPPSTEPPPLRRGA